ncbi:hypothetical protein BGX38DRAFT_1278244 [Terfezia claveryi]|nr:hypothetical protein BGX38DRAFT_1278244 [Terfezia claveryi]
MSLINLKSRFGSRSTFRPIYTGITIFEGHGDQGVRLGERGRGYRTRRRSYVCEVVGKGRLSRTSRGVSREWAGDQYWAARFREARGCTRKVHQRREEARSLLANTDIPVNSPLDLESTTIVPDLVTEVKLHDSEEWRQSIVFKVGFFEPLSSLRENAHIWLTQTLDVHCVVLIDLQEIPQAYTHSGPVTGVDVYVSKTAAQNRK